MGKLNRRQFIISSAASGLALAGSGLIGSLVPRAHAYSPNNLNLIMVYLRGGADIGLQMIQPHLTSSISIAVNQRRPTIYDATTIQNRILAGTDYGYHQNFTALNAIHTQGDLAIIPRVGINNLLSSHQEAELAFARGNPDADAGPNSGVLQRLAQTYFSNSGDLLDLSGGHPTTSLGGSFTPLSLYRMQQPINVNATLDGILFTRESLFRLTMYYRAMQQAPLNGNAEMDAAQQKIAEVGNNDGIIRQADNAVGGGYANTQAGILFRDAEYMFRYGHTTDALVRPKVAFGVIDDTWDSHRIQNQSGSPFQNAVSRLSAAIDRYRLNTTNADPTLDLWNKTVIVVFTEMGRSTPENSRLGTDHGDANAVLVMGGRVNGGVYGPLPTIAQIQDKRGTIPLHFTWTDVLADIFTGMGYNPAPIFPGYSRQPLNLIS